MRHKNGYIYISNIYRDRTMSDNAKYWLTTCAFADIRCE